jgi:hypothetical protein
VTLAAVHGAPVRVLSRAQLITVKRAAGRHKDLEIVTELEVRTNHEMRALSWTASRLSWTGTWLSWTPTRMSCLARTLSRSAILGFCRAGWR